MPLGWWGCGVDRMVFDLSGCTPRTCLLCVPVLVTLRVAGVGCRLVDRADSVTRSDGLSGLRVWFCRVVGRWSVWAAGWSGIGA